MSAVEQQQQPLPVIGPLDLNVIKAKYDAWVAKQPVAVEVCLTGLASGLQGAAMGFVIGQLSGSVSELEKDSGSAGFATALKAMQTATPVQQAVNLGVLLGVNTALTLAISKARKGKDDVWGSMGASFGSGVAYSLVSGAPNPIQSALSTGMAFAIFNGIIYQVRGMFKPPPEQEDIRYERSKYLLKSLGLTKYADNLKKCFLDDTTLLLWNNDALAEAKIPPGPRLLILHHLDVYYRGVAAAQVLKPALPVGPVGAVKPRPAHAVGTLPPLPPPPAVGQARQ